MGSKITAQTKRELVIALRARYAASSRIERARILDQFTSISGYHRKSATRILNGSSDLPEGVRRRPRPRLYDEAVRYIGAKLAPVANPITYTEDLHDEYGKPIKKRR